MKYAALFFAVAGLLAFSAVHYGGSAWLLLWPAAVFAWIGLGYLALGPRVFGKRRNGSIDPAMQLVLAPYFLYLWGIWRTLRWLENEPPTHELAPGIFIGRRLRRWEIPPGITLVVDLTSEFPATPTIRDGREYVLFPILDAHVPRESDMLELVETIVGHGGGVYLHCAEGHGRTGMFAAALLMRLGIADESTEAIRLAQQIRPGIRVRSAQRRLLRQLEPILKARRESENRTSPARSRNHP